MKLREPKIFSLKEARETLQFVSQITQDLLQTHQQIQLVEEEIRNSNEFQRNLKVKKQTLLAQYTEYYHELLSVGCQCNNPEQGIVEYYWDRGDGLIVQLYWKLGNDDILYWHEIGSSYLHTL